jgi:LmbE family N-acetylglucosaminyl deacetylase
MRALFIHAHFDDYEFTAAGTFELCRRALGRDFRAKVVVCTDGAAGHHWRTRRETARLRLAEQRNSARLGNYGFELLRFPNGRVSRECCLEPNAPLLAALWKVIRDFEPDYLFCPPLPSDPRAGVHVDHLVVSDAVRRVAYLINVPHAFTPEFAADERRSRPCKVPVILHTYDAYMHGANACDLVVDVEAAFDLICRLTWCHQSQLREWLPWVGRHELEVPESLDSWASALRARMLKRQRQLGVRTRRLTEQFAVTSWGEIPAIAQLKRDFPGLMSGPHLRRLAGRLSRSGRK